MAKRSRIDDTISTIKSLADPNVVQNMARFGIRAENAYGVSIPVLRKMAKDLGKDHVLAQGLWRSGIHDARILASMIDDPAVAHEHQLESWVSDFYSWDLCDQVCNNLFVKTEWAWKKAAQWSKREGEFVKRAGFVLMACLAVHDKKASNQRFEELFPLIKEAADDNRNFVKKATNWALRQIGKRNIHLNRLAIAIAEDIRNNDRGSARWIGSDAIRELTSEAVRKRLKQ
ncbi:MAG: DNA alkylation repair protein [Phycisphaerales bacterium]|nr:MAG: DNA alkylation repair protein [Phycisphaerales bacterium]